MVNRPRSGVGLGVIGGVLIAGPAADVCAAPLDANLVVNGGFESVDLATTGGYNGPRILGWAGTPSFAYAHGGGFSSGGSVPDYASGGPLAGGGQWYFTSNNAMPDISGPGQFFQDIDVSTDPSATAIAAGRAEFNLSAYMTGYMNESDFGSVHILFRDGGGASLGSQVISDGDPTQWALESASGSIPVGTASVRISVYGTAGSGGPDGFVDNVSFRISQLPAPVPVLPEPRRSAAAALTGMGLFAFLFRMFRRRRGLAGR